MVYKEQHSQTKNTSWKDFQQLIWIRKTKESYFEPLVNRVMSMIIFQNVLVLSEYWISQKYQTTFLLRSSCLSKKYSNSDPKHLKDVTRRWKTDIILEQKARELSGGSDPSPILRSHNKLWRSRHKSATHATSLPWNRTILRVSKTALQSPFLFHKFETKIAIKIWVCKNIWWVLFQHMLKSTGLLIWQNDCHIVEEVDSPCGKSAK